MRSGDRAVWDFEGRSAERSHAQEVEMRVPSPGSMWRKGWAGLLMLVTIGLLAGCVGAATPTQAVPADEVPPVLTETEGKVVAEASIEPNRWSELRFDVAGDVAEVMAQQGDVVPEGEILALLDSDELERAVAQAELSFSQAQVRLEQAELRLRKLQEPPNAADR